MTLAAQHDAQPILLDAEIRAIESAHVSAVPRLMVRAGEAAAAQALVMLEGQLGHILVVCGPGNNGGDGFVVATSLLAAACHVTLACFADINKLPHEAKNAHDAFVAAGGEVQNDFEDQNYALVVDGLFGLGLARPIGGRYSDWIRRINAMPCPVLALDLPSGIHSESGRVLGQAINASKTVTFIALKPGLLTLDGPDHCGDVVVEPLGLPPPPGSNRRIAPCLFRQYLKPRLRNVHKGSFGSLAVIGGAPGMLGAAVLASRAGLYLGTGKVFLAAQDTAAPPVDFHVPEIMIRPAHRAMEEASAILIGPGLGTSDDAAGVIERVLSFDGGLVLDADALNLLATTEALALGLPRRSHFTVLTPHPKEAAKLLQRSVPEVQFDRVRSACEVADRFSAVVVLKGCGSIVAAPGGRWHINTTGHPGMAMAGMGDVLGGFIGGLMAQGWDGLAATLCGVHLHGCAADSLAAHGVGPVGVLPSETLSAARSVFNAWLTSTG